MFPDELTAIKNLFTFFPEVRTLEFKQEGRSRGFAINGSMIPCNLMFSENNWNEADKAWLVEQGLSGEVVNTLRKNHLIPPRPFSFNRSILE